MPGNSTIPTNILDRTPRDVRDAVNPSMMSVTAGDKSKDLRAGKIFHGEASACLCQTGMVQFTRKAAGCAPIAFQGSCRPMAKVAE